MKSLKLLSLESVISVLDDDTKIEITLQLLEQLKENPKITVKNIKIDEWSIVEGLKERFSENLETILNDENNFFIPFNVPELKPDEVYNNHFSQIDRKVYSIVGTMLIKNSKIGIFHPLYL